jgi:choline dehydrogenase-like flavoprotein
MSPRVYRTDEEVDFVIVGAGAAGGVIAKELSAAGFDVVVLEQGPWWKPSDFKHDEYGSLILMDLCGGLKDSPQSFRESDAEVAQPMMNPPPVMYAHGVGGSSVHFTANYWRFHPIDFNEHSRWGDIAGADFADWPISYEEMEPYYTKVDWEIGVSGAPGPFDPPRSKPFPMPPLPIKSSGVLLDRGARALGWHAQPAQMAIPSRPYDGRPACQHCGFCVGYGCEYGAKSSTLVTMFPKAVASGRCEVRTGSIVHRVEIDARGRATGVVYFDPAGAEQRQRAKVVILSANGAETARLLLLSESNRFPHGLANSSGEVGTHLMPNGNTSVFGLFEHPLNEYKSVQVTRFVHDFYDADPKRGFYGGGGFDARMSFGPMMFAMMNMPREDDGPPWGADFTRALHEYPTHAVEVESHTTSLPVRSNAISLDPKLKDRWGRPALRTTFKFHPDDMKTMQFFSDRAEELLHAAGAKKVWRFPVADSTNVLVHLLGTCRMGHDPRSSVVDRYHRSHDVRNLFICDGSSFVTSGRGQPTMTIQALAFRASDHIARFAKRGEL